MKIATEPRYPHFRAENAVLSFAPAPTARTRQMKVQRFLQRPAIPPPPSRNPLRSSEDNVDRALSMICKALRRLKRTYKKVPHGHWKTTTVIGALYQMGMSPLMRRCRFSELQTRCLKGSLPPYLVFALVTYGCIIRAYDSYGGNVHQSWVSPIVVTRWADRFLVRTV
jgi:hypothetical protein